MRKTILALIVVMMLGFGFARRIEAQDEGPGSTVRFLVLRDSDGKPLRNAEVVLHPVNRKGKQASGEMELKTDADGKASIDGIPFGVLRVQVLAPRFQTFGEDYEINKPVLEITVKMKHPGGQYSTYETPKTDDKKPQ